MNLAFRISAILSIISFLCFEPINSNSQNINDILDWENPAIFESKQMPAQADVFPYGNKILVTQGDRSQSKWFKSLYGTWKFNWVKRPQDRPEDFYKINHEWQKALEGLGY